MTQRILVAVDGRPAAEHALDWAAHRAAAVEAELTVFQAVDTPRPPIGTREHHAAIEKVAEEIAERSLARVRERAPDVAVSARIEHGNVVKLLEAASDDVDLVVVGTNATGSITWTLSGGTRASAIAAVSHCPVVTVPVHEESHERRGVLVGVDGSELSEHAIEFAAQEADRAGEPLIAVSTWNVPSFIAAEVGLPTGFDDSFRETAEEALSLSLAGVLRRHPGIEVDRRVEKGDPAHVLIAAGATAKLTVVGSRGRGGVRRLLLGSVSQSLLQHPPGPVAVVR